jgi:hypothetical protein
LIESLLGAGFRASAIFGGHVAQPGGPIDRYGHVRTIDAGSAKAE